MPKTHVQPDATEVVKLRVRTENGQRNIMLTLLPTDNLKMVYKYVCPYIETKNKEFTLFTNFP